MSLSAYLCICRYMALSIMVITFGDSPLRLSTPPSLSGCGPATDVEWVTFSFS